jgi:hypothetical protein
VNSGVHELYVYYRVVHADVARARQLVESFQQRLMSEQPALSARVLRRTDAAAANDVTLMEVYRAESAIDDALEQRIETAAAALAPLLIGVRHVERFTPLDGATS